MPPSLVVGTNLYMWTGCRWVKKVCEGVAVRLCEYDFHEGGLAPEEKKASNGHSMAYLYRIYLSSP